MTLPPLRISRPALALRLCGLALGTAAAMLGAGAAQALDTIAVQADRASVMRLPPSTTTVIVGNPAIADISVQKNGSVVITGKAYGTTNLISQDASGAVIAEHLIRVESSVDGQVLVQRGMDRETYSCTPRCQPTINVGDMTKYFEAMANQANLRNNLAK